MSRTCCTLARFAKLAHFCCAAKAVGGSFVPAPGGGEAHLRVGLALPGQPDGWQSSGWAGEPQRGGRAGRLSDCRLLQQEGTGGRRPASSSALLGDPHLPRTEPSPKPVMLPGAGATLPEGEMPRRALPAWPDAPELLMLFILPRSSSSTARGLVKAHLCSGEMKRWGRRSNSHTDHSLQVLVPELPG